MSPSERPPLPEPKKAPHVKLNEDLVSELRRSYYECTDIEVPTGPSTLTEDLIRQARIFARRTGTSFSHRFGRKEGQPYMVFSLSPRRAYNFHDLDYWESL